MDIREGYNPPLMRGLGRAWPGDPFRAVKRADEAISAWRRTITRTRRAPQTIALPHNERSELRDRVLGLGSRVCQRFVEQLYQCIPIEGVGLSLVELHELLDLRLDGDVGLLTFGDHHVASLRVGL